MKHFESLCWALPWEWQRKGGWILTSIHLWNSLPAVGSLNIFLSTVRLKLTHSFFLSLKSNSLKLTLTPVFYAYYCLLIKAPELHTTRAPFLCLAFGVVLLRLLLSWISKTNDAPEFLWWVNMFLIFLWAYFIYINFVSLAYFIFSTLSLSRSLDADSASKDLSINMGKSRNSWILMQLLLFFLWHPFFQVSLPRQMVSSSRSWAVFYLAGSLPRVPERVTLNYWTKDF